MKEHFLFRDWYCIVSELLEVNLYKFQTEPCVQKITGQKLKSITRQCLEALAHLKAL